VVDESNIRKLLGIPVASDAEASMRSPPLVGKSRGGRVTRNAAAGHSSGANGLGGRFRRGRSLSLTCRESGRERERESESESERERESSVTASESPKGGAAFVTFKRGLE